MIVQTIWEYGQIQKRVKKGKKKMRWDASRRDELAEMRRFTLMSC
jgi:hypothetical protein